MTIGKFPLLSQDGPFVIRDDAPSLDPFSRENRVLVQALHRDRMATKYRVIRNQICEFLGVRSFGAIAGLIPDKDRRRVVGRRGYELLGNMFGIQGNEREIVSTVKSYSRTADAVIRYLKDKVLAPYASYVEMTNEIDTLNNPLDLLLIIFDDRYHQKARFEAKRKLFLMNLAGSIDQRERETDIENKFTEFLDFLNEYVWSGRSKIGELEIVFLVSRHEPTNFSCQEVRVLTPEQAAAVTPKPGWKKTLVKRRRFQVNGREVPIYVSIRKKASETKVLKLLRKGEENPAVAVDDELGLMAVLDSTPDVRAFQRHLTQSAIQADSFMTLEEISDTLTGGRHKSSSIGSSSQTPMFKFFARMGGMRVEFIIHTNKTYLNYIYQRDISHDEYEVKRIFDSGVAELLFPREIYQLDMARVREERMQWFRRAIEES